LSDKSHPSREPDKILTARGSHPGDGRIDLWHANLQYSGWPRLSGLLSDQENHQAQAFTFERDARRYVVSHAILRTLLGCATGTPAQNIRLRTEQSIKPVLKLENVPPVHFSLSRSEELVLIGFASRPLGVDIERLSASVDVEALANHVFTNREEKVFRRLDPASRPKAFLQCWTKKEAYLKAIGMGIVVPPTAIEVCFGCGEPAGANGVDHAAGWFIEVVAPAEGYVGAVAVRGRLWQVEINAFDTSSLLD
jgi:4'-phosphopantetheinyl transferase